ncbi:MAG: type I-U CRISPR-associated protein Cas7 [Actinobacteria bacterium]|nr:type I-U CRISPR-associated protein Cas7 [Actinomycetota bacterium]
MTSNVNRRLFDVALEPVSGSLFQPTGFPDIGNALFQRPVRNGSGDIRWEDSLLVESAQSMANRLEGTAWDASTETPASLFDGLPYVRVVHDADDSYLTSSRTEAHRLASAFIKDASLGGEGMKAVIKERLRLQDDRPLSQRDVAAGVFAMDPFCLVHGVFFAEPASVWPGQPKVLRAVTGVIEAHDVRRADSGGVKKDHVRHSLSDVEGGTAEGYGTVPFHRTEWTAAEIVASFSVDRAQIRSYGLGDPATELLEAISLWEIRTLLDGVLRLRTACDLGPLADSFSDQAGEPLPDAASLEADIRRLIPETADLVGDGQAIEVRWAGGKKRGKS